MSNVITERQRFARIFQYAKLAMRYTLAHDSQSLGEQAKIREELGMTDEESWMKRCETRISSNDRECIIAVPFCADWSRTYAKRHCYSLPKKLPHRS